MKKLESYLEGKTPITDAIYKLVDEGEITHKRANEILAFIFGR